MRFIPCQLFTVNFFPVLFLTFIMSELSTQKRSRKSIKEKHGYRGTGVE